MSTYAVANLPCVVARHRCFNLLDMPTYSSIGVLLERLETCMVSANEFTDL